jgi:hypothetical protein
MMDLKSGAVITGPDQDVMDTPVHRRSHFTGTDNRVDGGERQARFGLCAVSQAS